MSASNYAVPLPIDRAGAALLAEELNGAALAAEHGGPRRPVMPGSSCFTSVKWVDRLEVLAEPGDASGERIARTSVERDAEPARR